MKGKSRLSQNFIRLVLRHLGACDGPLDALSVEKLVAEIGAAFLCAELGITPETREDHAVYIESWLTVLTNDKRAIFAVAAHAQRASALLQAHACQKVA